MKQGGDRKKASGFTIVETLIVLAVTGGLFISAALLINGKQNKTEFYTAANNLQQQFQQIINETASGYFPDTNTFTCSAGVLGTPPNINIGTPGSQGTNGDCIFLGKALQFGNSSNPDAFQVYSLAGNRVVNSQEVTDLVKAYPAVISPLTVSNHLENGLVAKTMAYDGTSTGGVAFLTSFPKYGDNGVSSCKGTSLCAGTQTLQLYGVSGSAIGDDDVTFTNTLNGGGAKYVPAKKVTICFDSGTTTSQSALYTIGDNDTSQSVTMQIQGVNC